MKAGKTCDDNFQLAKTGCIYNRRKWWNRTRHGEGLRLCRRAIDRAEHARGSCCVAAPIFDANNRPIGAISVSGRDIEPLIKHHELVRHTAEVISHHLL